MNFQDLYAKADAAGKNAVAGFTPQPMVVGEAKSLFSNEIDRTKPVYKVADGVCGFAWIKFKGNTPWARWAKAQGYAKAAYPSGMHIWVSDYNQSMQKKERYAQAFAKVLKEEGIDAYADSRMD